MDIQYPNLLVISNNSLSDSNSNGRTLAGFLKGWPKEKLAQFYITGETPNSSVCDNFFRVTDKEMMVNIFRKNRIGKTVCNSDKTAVVKADINSKLSKKTIFKIAARDIVWSSNLWWNKNLKNWLSDFSPQIILFFAGESAFTFNITKKIANYLNIPIVIYNSEGYYFKKKNYLKSGNWVSDAISSMIYPFFHSHYKRVFTKMMAQASHTVYINNKLKTDYDSVFKKPSTTIYTASDIEYIKTDKSNKIPMISYLGNLGVGRHLSLIEIGNALQSINPDLHLNVYGKTPNDSIKNELLSCNGIKYNGLISYEEVKEIMRSSNLLVHAESFDDFTVNDLKYAFTTKIADSLSCGTCFFVYAHENLACSEYLSKNECACVVTDKTKLQTSLADILTNIELQNKYIKNGLELAKKNHNGKQNSKQFQDILIKEACTR